MNKNRHPKLPNVRRYAVEQGIAEEEALAKDMEEKSNDSSRRVGEREDFCAAKGRRPRLREQPSQFVEQGAEVYAKA